MDHAQTELFEGTNRDLTMSQYFTPAKLAQRVVEWAGVHDKTDSKRMHSVNPPRVLEPSAGNGALVRPLVAAGAEVVAYELDERYEADLLKAGAVQVWCGFSFIEQCSANEQPRFDLCVMNPPYHENLAAEFIMHALEFAPRVVGIFQADIFYTVGRYEQLWTRARPTRAAMLARRPWSGETDYVVLEIVKLQQVTHPGIVRYENTISMEFWPDAWR